MFREDLWKIGVALVAVAGAISAHALALPDGLNAHASLIEFICTAITIGAAVFINKPGSLPGGK